MQQAIEFSWGIGLGWGAWDMAQGGSDKELMVELELVALAVDSSSDMFEVELAPELFSDEAEFELSLTGTDLGLAVSSNFSANKLYSSSKLKAPFLQELFNFK